MNNPVFVYLNINGQSAGPYTLEQCAQMLAKGQIMTSTLASFGGGAWRPLNASGYWGQLVQLSSAPVPGSVLHFPSSLGGQPSMAQTGLGVPAVPSQPMGSQSAIPFQPSAGGAIPIQPVGLRPTMPAQPPGFGAVPAPPLQPQGGVRPTGSFQPAASGGTFSSLPAPDSGMSFARSGGAIPVAIPVSPLSSREGFSFVSNASVENPIQRDEFSGNVTAEESYLEPEDMELEEDDNSPQMLCMHCWYLFRQARIRYISRHPDLLGDSVLGPSAQKRFLPRKFNAKDEALDDRGVACTEMACPRCHLTIPEVILEHRSSLLSIVGAPSAGKSYFLTAMIHALKKSLGELNYVLVDADPTHNMVLSHYEELLFENRRNDQLVALPKTELQGDGFSSQTQIDGMTVELPLPFVYTLRTLLKNGSSRPHNLVFYDNAGEQFEPGRDFLTRMATNHLLQSNCIFFLFDPFKDNRTVVKCSSEDPQAGVMARFANQLQIFNEMVSRIRLKSGGVSDGLYSIPLVVLVPKYDAWKDSFALNLSDTSVIGYDADHKPALNMSVITLTSYLMRDWLRQLVPELVNGAETVFREVYYLPLSALGQSPILDPKSQMLNVKAANIQPVWADVPLLFYLWHDGFLPGIRCGVADEVSPVDEYCRFEDGMMFFTPPNRKSMMIPQIYWGQEVHDEELGFIRFPQADAADSREGAGFHF